MAKPGVVLVSSCGLKRALRRAVRLPSAFRRPAQNRGRKKGREKPKNDRLAGSGKAARKTAATSKKRAARREAQRRRTKPQPHGSASSGRGRSQRRKGRLKSRTGVRRQDRRLEAERTCSRARAQAEDERWATQKAKLTAARAGRGRQRLPGLGRLPRTPIVNRRATDSRCRRQLISADSYWRVLRAIPPRMAYLGANYRIPRGWNGSQPVPIVGRWITREVFSLEPGRGRMSLLQACLYPAESRAPAGSELGTVLGTRQKPRKAVEKESLLQTLIRLQPP